MVLVFFLGSCPFLFFFDIDSFSFSYCENKCKKSAQLYEFCRSIRGHVDAGMVTGLDPGYYGKGKGAGTRGERGTVIVTVIVVTRFVETVPWRLLQRIARMDMLLKKLDQLFQVVSAP